MYVFIQNSEIWSTAGIHSSIESENKNISGRMETL